jgi:hypothetical protein
MPKAMLFLASIVLILVGLAVKGLAFQVPPAPAGAVSEAESAPIPVVDPLKGLEGLIETFHRKPDPSEERQLAAFERDIRDSLASGWRPPWSGLDVQMSDEELASVPTEALAKLCFASGLPARTSLLYSNPSVSFRRLEVAYNGFGELFGRDDAWKIPIAVIDLFTTGLDPNSRSEGTVNVVMGLTTLPELYVYPKVRARIAGHEKEIITAHIHGLEKTSAFLASEAFSSDDPASRLFFSVTSPIALVQWALVLGRDVSAERYDEACAALSQFTWLQDENPRCTQPFIDRAIKELKLFINEAGAG